MPRYKSYRRRQIPITKQPKKTCRFCANPQWQIDYKDERLLNQFISGQAKIKKNRRTGLCSKHQRKMTKAIKRSRNMGILPVASVHNFFNVDEKRAEKEKMQEERAKETMMKAKVTA